MWPTVRHPVGCPAESRQHGSKGATPQWRHAGQASCAERKAALSAEAAQSAAAAAAAREAAAAAEAAEAAASLVAAVRSWPPACGARGSGSSWPAGIPPSCPSCR